MSEQNIFSNVSNPVPPARLDDDDEDEEKEEEAKAAQMPQGVGAMIQRKFLETRRIFLCGH
jgi:hypothetical protein